MHKLDLTTFQSDMNVINLNATPVTFLTITEQQSGNNQGAQYVLLITADNTQLTGKEKPYSNY
jgi:hypothetical protein